MTGTELARARPQYGPLTREAAVAEAALIPHPAKTQAALDQLDKDRELVLSKTDPVRIAEEVVAECRHLYEDSDGTSSLTLNKVVAQNIRFGDGWCKIYLTQRAKMDEVVPVIRWLRKRGIKVKTTEDFPESKNRVYACGDIAVSVFLKQEGAACRYVQTGTRRVPVYELKCEEKS